MQPTEPPRYTPPAPPVEVPAYTVKKRRKLSGPEAAIVAAIVLVVGWIAVTSIGLANNDTTTTARTVAAIGDTTPATVERPAATAPPTTRYIPPTTVDPLGRLTADEKVFANWITDNSTEFMSLIREQSADMEAVASAANDGDIDGLISAANDCESISRDVIDEIDKAPSNEAMDEYRQFSTLAAEGCAKVAEGAATMDVGTIREATALIQEATPHMNRATALIGDLNDRIN